MIPPDADGERAVRLRDLDDQETSNSASAWRHGRRAVVALVLAGVFGSYAGEVGPQAYSIAAGLTAWGGLSGTRVLKAIRRLRAARAERGHLLLEGGVDAGDGRDADGGTVSGP